MMATKPYFAHLLTDVGNTDQEWLDTISNERRHDQLKKVSYETSEIIMDRLEKEWFDPVRINVICLHHV